MMIACREVTFDAAHKITNYNGPCKNLHGHTYRLQICVKGDIKKDGLVLDLKELKQVITERVLNLLDHQYLNDILDNPTSENIAIWIWDKLKEVIPLYEVKLWETPNNFVIYNGL